MRTTIGNQIRNRASRECIDELCNRFSQMPTQHTACVVKALTDTMQEQEKDAAGKLKTTVNRLNQGQQQSALSAKSTLLRMQRLNKYVNNPLGAVKASPSKTLKEEEE